MSYASELDVQVAAGDTANLVALTDQNGTLAIDPVVLARFQVKAGPTIHGYLRLRYATPLASPARLGSAAELGQLVGNHVHVIAELAGELGWTGLRPLDATS